MKLAFIGAHCSGKSTLIKALAEIIPSSDLYVIHGIVRKIIAKGFPMGKCTTVDSLLNYLAAQLSCEQEASATGCIHVFSDRTVADALAYTLTNRRLGYGNLPAFLADTLAQVWELEQSRYDACIYCPPEFPIVPDGIRDNDDAYRAEVDAEFRSLLGGFKVDIVMVGGTVNERLNTVRSYLRL